MKQWCLLLILATSACAASADSLEAICESDDPGECVDLFEDKNGPKFDKNFIVSDSMFQFDPNITANSIQSFLEKTPYSIDKNKREETRIRSWLADHTLETTLNGQRVSTRAADVIWQVAEKNNINPVLLLARIQTEATLVSKTKKPTQALIDAAAGCGCPDGGRCTRSYKGFENQLTCAAEIFNKWYDASAEYPHGITTWWRKDFSRKTNDPIAVTPSNHATAAMYAYTPWVLTGKGGNWLMWRTTETMLPSFYTHGYCENGGTYDCLPK